MATRKREKPQIPPPPDAGASAEELAAYFEKHGLDELEAAGYVHDLTPAEEKELSQYEDIDDYLSYLNRLIRNMAEAQKEEG